MRIRFSIVDLLILVLFCAVGMAALRYVSPLWYALFFSITIASFTIGSLHLAFRRGERRRFWIGFQLCGGVYFLIVFAPWLGDFFKPRLVTTGLLQMLCETMIPIEKEIDPVRGSIDPAPNLMSLNAGEGSNDSHPHIILAYQMIGGFSGVIGHNDEEMNKWEFWTKPMDPYTGLTRNGWTGEETFENTGHCLFTLLFAYLGGIYARRRFADSPANGHAGPATNGDKPQIAQASPVPVN